MLTYKQKFDASATDAHNKNIATKIDKDMTELRAMAADSPIVPRRWVWELIQNAKDVSNSKGVKIRIELNSDGFDDFLKFEHNGLPFSADNIRYLIEQISSKDREKEEDGRRKASGKFGTGFLTTHLLSEIVTVDGVAKEPELSHRKFQMTLDRSGMKLSEIIDAVDSAKKSVSNLDELPTFEDYNDNDYNTAFFYSLNDNLNLIIAQKGIDDLKMSVCYALTFVSDIDSIELVNEKLIFSNQIRKQGYQDFEIGFHEILCNGESFATIATINSNFTSIAIPVSIENSIVTIQEINNTIPTLFCDFPLIGTEVFPFPAIINNPNFNPKDPRDSIYLNDSTTEKVLENKGIIIEAVELYFHLLTFASENGWKNLHLLAKIKPLKDNLNWVYEPWFNDNVLNPIRNKLLYANIVSTASYNLDTILNTDGRKYIWFPSSHKKEVRETIWKMGNKWFPHVLPKEEEVDLWYSLIWSDCGKLTLEQFANFVANCDTLEKLQEALKDSDAIGWLNDFYNLLKLDEKEFHVLIDTKSIIPNQNGTFSKKNQLSGPDGPIEKELKDILTALGNDIRDTLADEGVNLEFDRTIDEATIIKEIISEVTEKANDRDLSKKYKEAFTMLLQYFRKFPEKSKSNFSSLYRVKHILYDDDEISTNLDKAEQLDDLLANFKVSNTDELRRMLEQASTNLSNTSSLLPVTEEILSSMGITTPEAWAEALEDKDLQAMFDHDSVPTTDMFVLAQTHIARAKKNVIAHLETLENYDLLEMDDQTATTVLAGIYKDGLPISIVFRPAYKGEVIIYYGSERDTLDYEPSELWVDDGIAVRQITLGHILKSAQIRKFPI